MEDLVTRIMENMGARVSGPMHLRIYMQPLMASVFGVISGISDARLGKCPYFWAVVKTPGLRAEMLKDAWRSVGKIFVIAMILDVIYQLIVERWLYPFEVVITAVILAIIPYLLIRGLTGRIATLFVHGQNPKSDTEDAVG